MNESVAEKRENGMRFSKEQRVIDVCIRKEEQIKPGTYQLAFIRVVESHFQQTFYPLE